MKIHLFIFSIILILLSCSENQNQKIEKSTPNSSIKLIDSIPNFDSTIIFTDLSPIIRKNLKLSETVAKNVLFEYFSKKGYCIEGINSKSKMNSNSICVSFDTTYLVNLNNDNLQDAIIEYWLAPHDANGHCFQPHKAIILSSGKKYELLKEDFIPTNIAIDSVVNTNKKQAIIYGYDYDCANGKITRRIKIVLSSIK